MGGIINNKPFLKKKNDPDLLLQLRHLAFSPSRKSSNVLVVLCNKQ